MVSDKVVRRGRWVLAAVTGAALAAGAAARLRARHSSGQPDAPADVGFCAPCTRRCAATCLPDAAAQLDSAAAAAPRVLAGWGAFRAQLDNHPHRDTAAGCSGPAMTPSIGGGFPVPLRRRDLADRNRLG